MKRSQPREKQEVRKTKVSKARSQAEDRCTDYARAVVFGEVVAGPWVRLACERHLRDLKRPKSDGLIWSLPHANRAIAFYEKILRLNGGDFEGRPFLLQPWQCFIEGSLFGWLLPNGYRRFRTAYIEIGKGNGKSPMVAGMGLYGMVADNEPRAEIYAAATKKDQAQILFRDAVSMVEQSPLLSERITKSGRTPVWNMADEKSGSWFRPISSDDGQSGPRPHFALIDEVHEAKDAQVIDMLRAGFKGRNQPMIVEITNSGVDRQSVCFQHHEYSTRILRQLTNDDAWFAYVCAMDEGDEPFEDEACWIKANPNLGVSIQPEYIRGQVREAKGMPAKQSVVRRLNFCQWVDAANPWISGEVWRRAEIEPDEWGAPDDIEPVGAIDLSGVNDLTALALVWRRPDGTYTAKVEFWTPKDSIIERSDRDLVRYDQWARDGHLFATPGNSIDYAFVAQRIGEWQEQTGLRRIAFDAYKIKYLAAELDRLGIEVELVPHGQGFYRAADSGLWMPHSIQTTERLLSNAALTVCKNPALTFAAASAVIEMDEKENRRFTKRKSTGRIDGIVALTMAIGLAESAQEAVQQVGIEIW